MIELLPEGYEQRLGNRGARLSGGQRQRIGLARALYRRPSFLVLDEIDASLDAESAGRLAAVLESLRGNCTVVVITHQERLLEVCDCRFEFGESTVRCIDAASRAREPPIRRLRSTP